MRLTLTFTLPNSVKAKESYGSFWEALEQARSQLGLHTSWDSHARYPERGEERIRAEFAFLLARSLDEKLRARTTRRGDAANRAAPDFKLKAYSLTYDLDCTLKLELDASGLAEYAKLAGYALPQVLDVLQNLAPGALMKALTGEWNTSVPLQAVVTPAGGTIDVDGGKPVPRGAAKQPGSQVAKLVSSARSLAAMLLATMLLASVTTIAVLALLAFSRGDLPERLVEEHRQALATGVRSLVEDGVKVRLDVSAAAPVLAGELRKAIISGLEAGGLGPAGGDGATTPRGDRRAAAPCCASATCAQAECLTACPPPAVYAVVCEPLVRTPLCRAKGVERREPGANRATVAATACGQDTAR